MKRFPFLSTALIAVLAVVAVGCTVPYETAGGGYYEDRVDRGGYYGSPYGSNVIVVERDPYTGRYYQVSPYGSYGYPAGGNRYYDSRYNNNRNVNRGTRYNNNVRNGGTYRNNDAQRQQQAQQREQQRQADVRKMESTKESILGKKKD
ncbi:MAG: hypothetical protein ACO1NX_09435 [Chitinophagaceae bacterium]